jgi:hypothetical protein
MIKKLGECRNDFLSSFYGKLSEFKTCEKLIKKHLPEKLLSHCKITDIRNNTIFITVPNTGILSLFRYEKLNLLNKLRTEEKMYALRSIELKLDAPQLRSSPPLPFNKPLIYSKHSCDSIHEAANNCTHSPLKHSLERLAETLKDKVYKDKKL